MTVATDAEAASSDWLFDRGALGVETVDHETLRYRDLASTLPDGHVQLVAYFEDDGSPGALLAEQLSAFLAAIGQAESAGSIACDAVAAEDWAEAWKQHFTVQHVSERIVVVPDWLPVPQPTPPVALRIHPGGAFGTGTHESTRLALRALDAVLRREPVTSLLDVGCGSAILSIAAARLGVPRIVGIDNDEGVFDNAALNLALNDVEGVELGATPIEELGDAFELVVANIIAPILQAIATPLVARTAPRGVFCSRGCSTVSWAKPVAASSISACSTSKHGTRASGAPRCCARVTSDERIDASRCLRQPTAPARPALRARP